jgi:two-component system chemotaxis response regulator CheY
LADPLQTPPVALAPPSDSLEAPRNQAHTNKAQLLMQQFQHPRQAGRDSNILIVDDYAHMRSIIKSVLRRMGYKNIQEAVDGEKALAHIRSTRVDLVISDLNMPEMNGIELLNAVRNDPNSALVPFLIITGEAHKNTVLAVAKAKVSAYLLKPFSSDDLKAKIEKILLPNSLPETVMGYDANEVIWPVPRA